MTLIDILSFIKAKMEALFFQAANNLMHDQSQLLKSTRNDDSKLHSGHRVSIKLYKEL